MVAVKKFLKEYKPFIEFITIPLFTAILPILWPTKEAYCGYVLIVMSLYWIVECIPYAITSLLPVVLYPLFGILASKETAKIYFQDILMLYFGGLVLATSVETTGLHKRLAFKIIMFFGSNPIWLLLGMMTVTGFLSLWISNVASASMMLPIVIAVVKQITVLDENFHVEQFGKKSESKNDVAAVDMNKSRICFDKSQTSIQYEDLKLINSNTNLIINTSISEELPETKAARNLMKGFCMSLTYAASIGGSGSLVGTAPNLILKGFFDQYYPKSGMNFFTFMLYALPTAVLMILFTWVVLSLIWLPKKYWLELNSKSKKNELGNYIKSEYEKLGPLSWEQGSVGSLFLLLVILWVTRDLYFVPGWGSLFQKGYVTDTTPAIFVLFLLVSWPKKNIFKEHKYECIITWKVINDNFPWNILLLCGGGLALAAGFEKSGLSDLIGIVLQKMIPSQKLLALLIIIITCLIGTEFMSNTSMASIIIPIANSLAEHNNTDASFLLLPLTISASYAFMLPVATPTNAIVFGTGYIKIKDLILSGLILKTIGLFVLFLSTVWLQLIFNNTSSFSVHNINYNTTFVPSTLKT